jgi:hypothetical protein
MKLRYILTASIIAFCVVSCHGTQSKDYDKNEKNDPASISVPSNSDATNPSLADTTYAKKDSSSKK